MELISTLFLAVKLPLFLILTFAVFFSLITPTATPAFKYSPSRILVKVLPPTLFGTVAFSSSFLSPLPFTSSFSLVLIPSRSSLPVFLASSINFLPSSESISCLPAFLTSSTKLPSPLLVSEPLLSVFPVSEPLLSPFPESALSLFSFSGSIIKGFSKGATSEPKTFEISPELVVLLLAFRLIEPFSAVILPSTFIIASELYATTPTAVLIVDLSLEEALAVTESSLLTMALASKAFNSLPLLSVVSSAPTFISLPDLILTSALELPEITPTAT